MSSVAKHAKGKKGQVRVALVRRSTHVMMIFDSGLSVARSFERRNLQRAPNEPPVNQC